MKHILLNEHLRSKFGERVQRIPLDPGFNCPNRDVPGGGCIFCDDVGSAAPWIKKGMSITEQLKRGSGIANARPEELERIYEEALSFDGVVGIAVSTRPDALPDDVVSVLERFSRRTYVWVEIGAQSMLEKSLEWMKRGHTPDEFRKAVRKIRDNGMDVVGHVIFGLPTETREETLGSFKLFLDTGINGYKIHALHIIKGTAMAKLYEQEPFKLLELEEYIDLVRSAVAMTPRDVVIHRVTGEVEEGRLIAPAWILKKNDIIRRVFE
jgi:radical SAM protein (TIGR01212 family)